MKRFGAVTRGVWNAKALDQPVVMKGLAKDWPSVGATTAPKSWQNFPALKARLQAVHGEEDSAIVVPVEFNGTYMDTDMQQHSVGFYSILDILQQEKLQEQELSMKALPSTKGGEGYTHMRWFLAQHELKDVSNLLLEDVRTPHMLLQPEASETEDARGEKAAEAVSSMSIYRTNIWLGGYAGTSSPCHFDPFSNIFVQIYGNKKVILFDPAHPDNTKEALYAAEGTLQKNTSLVKDITRVDGGGGKGEFPLYASAQGVEVLLEPGDALFIPHKWWHYCTTQSASCSVNWWFL